MASYFKINYMTIRNIKSVDILKFYKIRDNKNIYKRAVMIKYLINTFSIKREAPIKKKRL